MFSAAISTFLSLHIHHHYFTSTITTSHPPSLLHIHYNFTSTITTSHPPSLLHIHYNFTCTITTSHQPSPSIQHHHHHPQYSIIISWCDMVMRSPKVMWYYLDRSSRCLTRSNLWCLFSACHNNNYVTTTTTSTNINYYISLSTDDKTKCQFKFIFWRHWYVIFKNNKNTSPNTSWNFRFIFSSPIFLWNAGKSVTLSELWRQRFEEVLSNHPSILSKCNNKISRWWGRNLIFNGVKYFKSSSGVKYWHVNKFGSLKPKFYQ